MYTEGILQLYNIQFPIGHIAFLEIPPPRHRRYLHIFPVRQRLSEIILIHNIPERLSFLISRCRRHLKSQHRPQLINSLPRSIRMIPVSLIHQYHKVIQIRQILKIRLPKIFGQPPHFRNSFFTGLTVRIELRYIENIYLDRVMQSPHIVELIIIVSVHHYRRICHKLRNSLESILLV